VGVSVACHFRFCVSVVSEVLSYVIENLCCFFVNDELEKIHVEPESYVKHFTFCYAPQFKPVEVVVFDELRDLRHSVFV